MSFLSSFVPIQFIVEAEHIKDAALDLGDTRLVQTLLNQSPCARPVKSKKGETALSQTERFRYPLLAAATLVRFRFSN